MKRKITSEHLEQCVDLPKYDWHYICSVENIPIEILRQYEQYISWGAICQSSYYDFNDVNFVREFRDKMDWTSLMTRTDVSDQRKEQYKKEFNLVQVEGFTWWGASDHKWLELIGSKK